MEGKETRFGAAAGGLYATVTTGTSTGAVNAVHSSLTPIGGLVPLFNMLLGRDHARAVPAPGSTGCSCSPSWPSSSPA